MSKNELTILFDSTDDMRAYLFVIEFYRRKFKCAEAEVWLRFQNEIMNASLPPEAINKPVKRISKNKKEDTEFDTN